MGLWLQTPAGVGWFSFCEHSYLLMRRMVNTVPPDTEKAMAAEQVEMPGGVYLK